MNDSGFFGRAYWQIILVVCCGVFLACGDNNTTNNYYATGSAGAGNGGAASGVCSAYAEMCPLSEDLTNDETADPSKGYANVAACDTACTFENINANPTEVCAFIFCAVEVGLCDNEEASDTQIEACGVAYGWW